MKTIVITGSTRGIGLGLAEALLKRGCNVIISGRSQPVVDQVTAELATHYPAERIFGVACDVTRYDQLAQLWETSARRFGRVDIWVNNAGLANALRPFWELDPQDIQQVIDTNLLGSLLGSRVAFEKMKQQGGGAIYNMEGYGSTGRRMTNGLSVYGTTKAGIHFFNLALSAEAAETPILVSAIQPGMVMTDLVIKQYVGRPAEWKRVRGIFNFIAERVEIVAPWMADQVLSNTRSGVVLQFSSSWKLMLRFLLAPFQRRNIFQNIQEPE